MKNLFLLICLMQLFNCSKNSDDNSTSNQLLGEWNVTQIIILYPELEEVQAENVTGTITFDENGTGIEDYSYSIEIIDIIFSETESFTWTSNNSSIITDPGTDTELTWDRIENQSNLQIASYINSDGIRYTLTLTK